MHNQISVPTMIQLPSGGSFQIVGAIFHYGPTPSSGKPVESNVCSDHNPNIWSRKF